MKNWWRKWLYEQYVVGHAGTPAWLDRLPKPVRDELLYLLLHERYSHDSFAAAIDRFAAGHDFPKQPSRGRLASNVLYLKEGVR